MFRMRDRHRHSRVNGHEIHTTPPEQRPSVPFVYRMEPRNNGKLPSAPPPPHGRRCSLGEYLKTATDSERRLIARLRGMTQPEAAD